MPWNGIPMKLPVNFSSIQRPPRTQEFTAEPVDSIGGAPGCIHDLTVTVQLRLLHVVGRLLRIVREQSARTQCERESQGKDLPHVVLLQFSDFDGGF